MLHFIIYLQILQFCNNRWNYHDKQALKGKKFIDLFCGLGGFRLALESYGAECVFSSDIDSHVSKVYEKNFGANPLSDITKVDENEIPKHNILCAGFPCQAFSMMGKQKGFSDLRGNVFFQILEIFKI